MSCYLLQLLCTKSNITFRLCVALTSSIYKTAFDPCYSSKANAEELPLLFVQVSNYHLPSTTHEKYYHYELIKSNQEHMECIKTMSKKKSRFVNLLDTDQQMMQSPCLVI